MISFLRCINDIKIFLFNDVEIHSNPTFQGYHRSNLWFLLPFKRRWALFLLSDVKADSLKLKILKNYLRGYPLQIIQHLCIWNVNFSIAVDLKAEFLDIGLIKKHIFNEILGVWISSDHKLKPVKSFLTQVKADLIELKSSFDFFYFFFLLKFFLFRVKEPHNF